MNRYLTALFALLILPSCGEQSGNSVLQIGTNTWPGYEPLYLARHLEAWHEEDVRVIEYPSATEALPAFRSGSIDAASLTIDEVLELKQDNIDVWIIAIHDISMGADVIVAKPCIKSVADLKGKTLGVENNALEAFIVTRALNMHSLDTDDIKIIPSQVNSHEDLYHSGQIDAVVTFEPIKTKLTKAGAHEIFSSKGIPSLGSEPDELLANLITLNEVMVDNQLLSRLVDISSLPNPKFVEAVR